MRFAHVAVAALAAGVSTASSGAQLVATDHVAGWSIQSRTGPGQVDLQDVEGRCQAARRACGTVLQQSSAFHAGGSAWDATRQAVWVSDGVNLEVRQLPSCRVLCRFKASLMNSKAVVSGLAISTAKNRLYQLESTFGYVGIRSYDIRGCVATPLRDGCTLRIQSNAIAAGLAYDEDRDLLYFTESFAAFVGYITTLHVAKASDKCRPLCKVGMRSCGSASRAWSAVQGLAYDSCRSRLYATDGSVTSVTTLTDPANCKITHVGCCARGAAGFYRGLTYVPGSSVKRVGKSCLGGTCGLCPAMTSGLAGEPSLGNPAFGFQIAQGPPAKPALLVLGAGCGSGLQLPVLCDRLYPLLAPPPIISAPVALAGPRPCTGKATIPLPLPLARGLCGVQLCAQWLVACGARFGVSDAVEFKLVGT